MVLVKKSYRYHIFRRMRTYILVLSLLCMVNIEKQCCVTSNGVMSSPFLHKTIFFSESFPGDLMLYVAIKLNLKSSYMLTWSFSAILKLVSGSIPWWTGGQTKVTTLSDCDDITPFDGMQIRDTMLFWTMDPGWKKIGSMIRIRDRKKSGSGIRIRDEHPR